MKRNGFSLIEALMAAVIVAIGLTAAAALVGALIAKEEINTVSLRAANLQEQAVVLYRLGLAPGQIRAILPEICTETSTPSAGNFGLTFGSPSTIACEASDGSSFSVKITECSLVYPITAPDGSVLSHRANQVVISQPSTAWPVP
jgi:prepilin-type N-terminal cleavage/methylation domain-containing protein